MAETRSQSQWEGGEGQGGEGSRKSASGRERCVGIEDGNSSTTEYITFILEQEPFQQKEKCNK